MNKPLAKESAKPVSAAFSNWEDPFDLESQLTNDERMVRDTARGYAQEKLLPRVTEAFLQEVRSGSWAPRCRRSTAVRD
jgi:glutaryl-CoA dehydrogenase